MVRLTIWTSGIDCGQKEMLVVSNARLEAMSKHRQHDEVKVSESGHVVN